MIFNTQRGGERERGGGERETETDRQRQRDRDRERDREREFNVCLDDICREDRIVRK